MAFPQALILLFLCFLFKTALTAATQLFLRVEVYVVQKFINFFHLTSTFLFATTQFAHSFPTQILILAL
jgi:hypothetical protein